MFFYVTCMNEVFQSETRIFRGSDYSPTIALSEDKDKQGHVFEKLMVHNIPDIDLVSDNEYTKFLKFCPFILKIWSKNQSLMSIKGRNSVVNMRKTKIYNNNVDIVNDNVYTKFGFNLSFRSQDMEQNQILTSIKGRNSVANLRKNNDLRYQGRSCQ